MKIIDSAFVACVFYSLEDTYLYVLRETGDLFTGIIHNKNKKKIHFLKNGRFHREDGPAIVTPNECYYFLKDKQIIPNVTIKKCKKMKLGNHNEYYLKTLRDYT